MNTHTLDTINDKRSNNIIVVADTQSKADNIMNDFLFIIKDDPDFSYISRSRHTIYFKDDLGYVKFVGRNVRDNTVRGHSASVITDDAFEKIMDKFVSIRESIHES